MVELDVLQQFSLRVAGGHDRKGNPAPLEGIAFASSDPAVLAVTDNGDGTALCKAVAIGACNVQITADAHIGEGVTPISKLLEVTVKGAEAVDVDVEVGELENQPE